jgi:hypothetical protein
VDGVHRIGETALTTLLMMILSLPIIYVLRWWAYNSAFEGMSKTRRKKILKEYSQLKKHTLFFLLKHKNPINTKKFLVLYYCYIFIVISFITRLGLKQKAYFHWLVILFLDVVIAMIYLRQTRPK